MLVWMSLGVLLGALLVVGSFANDWFGVRTMIEKDVRAALKDEHFEKELAWEMLLKRREDEWPLMRDDSEFDPWEAFQSSPAPDPRPVNDEIDPWDVFGKGKGDA